MNQFQVTLHGNDLQQAGALQSGAVHTGFTPAGRDSWRLRLCPACGPPANQLRRMVRTIEAGRLAAADKEGHRNVLMFVLLAVQGGGVIITQRSFASVSAG